MMIEIKQLSLNASVGVHAWEQNNPRQLLVDVRLFFDGSAAAQSDDVRDTVDYTQVEALLETLFVQTHWNLLERLAQTSADALLREFALLNKVELAIHKGGALRFAPAVAVHAFATR